MSVSADAMQGHAIGLTLGRSRTQIDLSGSIDLAAVADLRAALGSLHLVHSVIRVDLGAVAFIDSTGLEPLIEATRSRRLLELPPLLIERSSPPVLRLLDALGLKGGPELDVGVWDQLAEPLEITHSLPAEGSASSPRSLPDAQRCADWAGTGGLTTRHQTANRRTHCPK